MSRDEKLEIIAEILEAEDPIEEEMILEDFETWDSVAVLSIIAMMDENFGKTLHASEVRKYHKVFDLMNDMES